MRKVITTTLIALSVVAFHSTTAEARRPVADTWAWCGVHPSDPNAQRSADTMANAGIDATFGPCMPPDWSTYSAAFPGQRYVTPDVYASLTVINANAGMQTVVYDARVWSDDPTVRQEAIDYWRGFLPWIRAFDMGDEFDGAEWPILVHRWNNVLNYVTPALGVGPFTNHLPQNMGRALADLPGAGAHLSFDEYNIGKATWLADYYDSQVSHLMCAVDAMGTRSATTAMRALRNDGCDSFLIFGGVTAYDPSLPQSLVRPNGTATSLLYSVRQGAS